jgi:hypothetical protein
MKKQVVYSCCNGHCKQAHTQLALQLAANCGVTALYGSVLPVLGDTVANSGEQMLRSTTSSKPVYYFQTAVKI